MLVLILFIPCFLGYSFALVRITEHSANSSPFIIITSMITLLYLFAYINFLALGIYVIWLLGILCFLSSPFYLKRDTFFTHYFTPGLILIFVLLLLYSSISYPMPIMLWDEVSHWGPHIKIMLFNSGFLNADDIALNKSYPPGSSLFYLLFLQLSGYSESIIYTAKNIAIIIPLALLANRLTWQRWKIGFIGLFIVTLILLMLNVEFGPKVSIYIDGLVGVYFGALIILYLNSKRQACDILWLLPGVFVFSLLKLHLLALVLVLFVIIAIDQILLYYFKHNNLKKLMLSLATTLSIPLVSLLAISSWNYHLESIGTATGYRGISFTLSDIVVSLNPLTASDFEITVIKKFIHEFINLSKIVFILLLLVVLVFMTKKTKEEKISLISTNLLLLFGFLAYVFGLLLLYLYNFSEYEAIGLASFERYAGIFIIAWFIVVLNEITNSLFNQKQVAKPPFVWKVIEIITLILILLFFTASYYYINHIKPERSYAQIHRMEIQKITKEVNKLTPPNSKIYIVWQKTHGLEHKRIIYDIAPRRPSHNEPWSLGPAYNTQDVWTDNLSVEQFSALLQQHDYLLLAHVDEHFWSTYSSLFNKDIDTLTPIASYQICQTKAFNSVGKMGCTTETYQAYLLNTRDLF